MSYRGSRPTYRSSIGRVLVDYRQSVSRHIGRYNGRLSIEYRSTVGEYRSSVGGVSVDFRPSVARHIGECRSTFRSIVVHDNNGSVSVMYR